MDRIREWETASQKAYAVSIMLLGVPLNEPMKMSIRSCKTSFFPRMVYEKLSTKYLQILDQLQVRKVDDEGELPGLMIEEMMESASVVS